MNERIEIQYDWNCSKLQNIPAALAKRLKETAEEHIFEKLRQGYTSGKLSANIDGIEIEGFEKPEWGWECHGWWKVEK